MKTKLTVFFSLLAVAALAEAQPKADLTVMTQNQYLGADLTPIITAPDAGAFNGAVIAALQSIAFNNLPNRSESLAQSIAERAPHLVGLQEMFAFACAETGTMPGACGLFGTAFSDHLELTLEELADLGAAYYPAAQVRNLDITLPVFLNGDLLPDVLVTVVDRDVILARADVDASAVQYAAITGCRPSLDGCNFDVVISVPTALGPVISVERGFVGVDATVAGQSYRFVNTHLEVQFPSQAPDAPLVQAAQATQLLLTLVTTTPASTRLLIAGDINSSPDDAGIPAGPVELLNPYQQFTTGRLIDGTPVTAPYADTWNLRPGRPPGHTCCQASDLSNDESLHDERIDVVFSRELPSRVRANVLDNDPGDRTALGLWPSDHSSVVAILEY